jgi:hypothetical protein
MENITAIDKMRIIVNWADNQAEYFNQQFKSFNQLEKVFNFAKAKGYQFLDNDYLHSELTQEEQKEVQTFLKKVLKSK